MHRLGGHNEIAVSKNRYIFTKYVRFHPVDDDTMPMAIRSHDPLIFSWDLAGLEVAGERTYVEHGFTGISSSHSGATFPDHQHQDGDSADIRERKT